jgi:hypothetical protein
MIRESCQPIRGKGPSMKQPRWILFLLFLITACPPGAYGQTMPRRYSLGPDSLPQEGVPQGRLEGPLLFKSRVLAGTVRKYWIYVPAQYDVAKAACVLVFQDGQRATNPNGVLRVPAVMDNLIHRKEMPVTIGIFITPGPAIRKGVD